MNKKLFTLFIIALVLINVTGCKIKTLDGQNEHKKPISEELVVSSENEPDATLNTSSGTSSTNSNTSSSKASTNSEVISTILPPEDFEVSKESDYKNIEDIEDPVEPVVTPTISSSESDMNLKEDEPEENEDIESAEELVGVNKLRPDYNLNDCRNLSGNVTVIIFYLDDFESSWTSEEITRFTEKEIKPGLKFLEDSAKKFNINLKLKIEEIHSSIYYKNEVEIDIKKSGYATADALYTVAKHLGYKSDKDLISNYKTKYSTEIICYCVFNKEGSSYALNPKRGVTEKIPEHVLMFAYDIGSTGFEPEGWQSSVVAHETLHLYGAEDYYTPSKRKALARKYCPKDIMLSCEYYLRSNNLGEATAFYIGWTDSVPSFVYDTDWSN